MKNLYATQKLWARRWMALGSFLYKIFKVPINFVLFCVRIPVTFYQFFKELDNFTKVFLTIVIALVSLFIRVVFNDIQLQKPAEGHLIAQVMAIDGCTENTMKLRAEEKSSPMTRRDVQRVKEDCEKYWEDQRILKEQKEALLKRAGLL